MNTTISISTQTRELLLNFGKKSESYDDVIRRMHNTIMLQKELEKFVDENEYSSLNEAIEWTKIKIKAEK
jgi:hypothetical protein